MKLQATVLLGTLVLAGVATAWAQEPLDPVLPTAITIDIKPGSDVNPINMKSKGKTPVAILTDALFDAANVDPATVLFGATGVEAAIVHWALEDIDDDGDLDLMCHFNTQETGLTGTDTDAVLTATAKDGTTQLVGSDVVRVKMPKVKPPKTNKGNHYGHDK